MSDEPERQTAVRVICECGGELALLVLPVAGDASAFTAVCPGCGTRYRRPLNALISRAERNETVSVRLPRSQPNG